MARRKVDKPLTWWFRKKATLLPGQALKGAVVTIEADDWQALKQFAKDNNATMQATLSDMVTFYVDEVKRQGSLKSNVVQLKPPAPRRRKA